MLNIANHVFGAVMLAGIAGVAIGWLLRDFLGSDSENLREYLQDHQKDLW